MKAFRTYHFLRITQRAARFASVVAVLFSTGVLHSQDIHFSQFSEPGIYVSPALAGDFSKEIRATARYRKQWASVGEGYSTSEADFEFNFLRKRSLSHLSVAAHMYNDKGGIANLHTFSGSGTVAYHAQTSENGVFAAGLNIGYLQRSIRFDGLAWDAQYDGISYDPSRDTHENLASQSKGILDASAGIMLKGEGDIDWKFAYGLHHLGQRRSFLDTYSDRLFTRHAALFSIGHRIPFVHLRYDVEAQRMAGAMEWTAGVMAEYRLGMDSRYTNINTSSAVYLGGHYRLGDAVIVETGFEYERTFLFFVSYDIHLSKLNVVTNMAGGPEFSLVYTGWLRQRRMKLK